MAELDIAERRVPQDGRIKIKVLNRSHRSARLVAADDLRREDRDAYSRQEQPQHRSRAARLRAGLDEGIRQRDRESRTAWCWSPGPTGSGKTTTLYSALSRVNTPEVNVLTAEDPVEYNLDGINQVLVNDDVGLTFAAALKAFLRQDPNIIMVGEIRDIDTASIAVKAALTGHLVLSTLHTNDAPSAIGRLIDMGIEPFLVASSVNLVLAQRLVRRVCANCKQQIELERGGAARAADGPGRGSRAPRSSRAPAAWSATTPATAGGRASTK